MNKKQLIRFVSVLLFIFIIVSCNNVTDKKSDNQVSSSGVVHPEWSKDMVLYELNVRQFTNEGTFAAIEGHIDRLDKLGVDVIWFMPVHPIGEINRKGALGSYYSIADFKGVNPEFGTMDDFKSLVNKIHDAGMYVIIDWVPNHSAWDNPLATEHPDWYHKDSSGIFVSPYDWTDVIQLNWEVEALQDYMLDALNFWVKDAGVDGFRVDHPHNTPAEFWVNARTEMERTKPVLLLAENEDRVEFLEKGYDMNYSWELHHLMNEVARGKKSYRVLDKALKADMDKFPENGFRLRFITNHDENSWAGTIEERMGPAGKAFAVYMYTIPGVPLLYNGQESGLNKRLKFFERDPIEWKECELTSFYTTLNRLKKENIALHNGLWGGSFSTFTTKGSDNVYAYLREKDNNRVITIINFSDKPVSFTVTDSSVYGDYTDLFKDEIITIDGETLFNLDQWSYMVVTSVE
ncbi:MAG: alpha-glucosidase C-terminal domain-containing protein [Bacteroidales bacterium]|nr:alpha-glucosidase C-terminal domain-containing protein [Bacteroidales bacterium]